MKNSLFKDEFHLSLEEFSSTTDRPLWSVLIPTYNCANYLRESLTSVLSQDRGTEQMEIIVIDDCSNLDDPKAVVDELGQGRVQFIKQKSNVGKVRNYESGLQASKGVLIHQLHGDDKIRKGFYVEMEHVFKNNPSAGAAFCRSIYIDENSRWLGITGMIQDEEGIVADMAAKLYAQQCIQTPSMVVKREVYEAIGGFDRRLDCREDWEMWTRISNYYPIASSNKVLAEYRTHSDSATHKTYLDGSALKTDELICSIIDGYMNPSIKQKGIKLRRKKQAEFWMLSYQIMKKKLTFHQKIKFILEILSKDFSLKYALRLLN